jgi:hypothetical protein
MVPGTRTGGIRTSFRRTTSRISRDSRILSNSSTGRLARLAECIRTEDKKVACDLDRKYRISLHGCNPQPT